jgi:glycosyltransferase involved in cell wall biosynthesis
VQPKGGFAESEFPGIPTMGQLGGASISIVLCTRNRAELLTEAIASVVKQDFRCADYEIVVVDNASTDRTAEVVAQFHHANIRYLREESLGLCIARNAGWHAAVGRYVVFFDDDAVAEPGWLSAIMETFERSPDRTGVIGGPVHPIWEAHRPAWLADPVACSLTIVDWGQSEKFISDIRCEWLVGANMAVPKDVLCEVGGFHPWLDRVGNNLLSSGDVFLQKEIMRRGYQCLYVPAMRVSHRVPASRLNQRWFEKRFFWQGISDAVMHLIEGMPSPGQRVRLALSTTKGVLGSRDKLASLLFRSEQPEVFTSRCLALIEIGFIAGLLGASGH